MAKISFDIKYRPQIESGEYKVETRDGRAVRIVCWDAKGLCPIIYLLSPIGFGGDSIENPCHCTNEGNYCNRAICQDEDLFIVTPEPEFTEFELKVHEILYSDKQEYSASDPESWKRASSELIDLARKELEPEVLERLESAYKNQDEVVYENGKRDGKAEALKDLPRWKPAARAYDGDRLPRIDWSLNRLVVRFEEGIFYLDIRELYKLPGFKE